MKKGREVKRGERRLMHTKKEKGKKETGSERGKKGKRKKTN